MINTNSLDWQKTDGLLPAIVQDSLTGQVLMLGYMNKVALDETIKTKRVTFYSRSKKRLWKKGETSGNTLELISIDSDCDSDALLIKAKPNGPICHTGARSCFGKDELPLETIGLLIKTIKQRATSSDDSSYTKQLINGGAEACGAKVLEEAEEVVRAARQEGTQRTVEEAADLLYHLLVLLEGEGVEIGEISKELIKRRK